MLHEGQGVCDGEGLVWKTSWRQHKRAFKKTPEVTALENLPQERRTRRFSLTEDREGASGGTAGGVQSSLSPSGLCQGF